MSIGDIAVELLYKVDLQVDKAESDKAASIVGETVPLNFLIVPHERTHFVVPGFNAPFPTYDFVQGIELYFETEDRRRLHRAEPGTVVPVTLVQPVLKTSDKQVLTFDSPKELYGQLDTAKVDFMERMRGVGLPFDEGYIGCRIKVGEKITLSDVL